MLLITCIPQALGVRKYPSKIYNNLQLHNAITLHHEGATNVVESIDTTVLLLSELNNIDVIFVGLPWSPIPSSCILTSEIRVYIYIV